MDKFSNHVKNVLHGFFITIGTTIAEPATILPLIVNYFGGSSMLVGLFAALLRGGAIVVQLFAAFQAQSYALMLPYLRRVFVVRFLAWFFIGVAIIGFGETSPNIALFSIGLGLFIFSFSAGFGAIYFRDIIGKIFSPKFRGKTMSYRQFFSAGGGLVSGVLAGYILQSFEAPYSFGYLFMISAFLMALGYLAFGSVDEPVKKEVTQREKSFKAFLRNSLVLLKEDTQLQTQLKTFLFAYGYLIAMPFIILDAQSKITLDGVAIGSLITMQMLGAMLSNILWGFLTSKGLNKETAHLAIIFQMTAVALAFFSDTLSGYIVIFFLLGAGADGNRIASGNLILDLAPPKKRPVYVALQMNVLALGMLFSILGGLLLQFFSYGVLYTITLSVLALALFYSFKLKVVVEEVLQ